jgi:SEC-C motif domain protein
MKDQNSKTCPCHSQKTYQDCCQKFHLGQNPLSACELMRSRYAAFALDLPDYILDSTHPDNPEFSHDKAAWRSHVSLFSKTISFLGLEILNEDTHGDEASVTFKAILKNARDDVSFREKSHFKNVDGKWLYLKGDFSPILD